MPITFLILVILSIAIAVATTRAVGRYGTGGMTAGMATMMSAMGTGLAVGYAAGMALDLAVAAFAGVLAGGIHGLWMGRRYGPMAALDGVGGGMMGGLMGPMLAVMLLYVPIGLALTALLMLGLQAAFSAGAVYLVASIGGAAVGTGWLGAVGRILGGEVPTVDAARDHYAVLEISPEASATEVAEAFLNISRRAAADPERLVHAREALAVLSDPVWRARYEALRQEEALCCPPKVRAKAARKAATLRAERSRSVTRALVVVAGVIVLSVLLIVGGAVPTLNPTASAGSSAPAGAPAASAAVVATVTPDGSQQVDMTLSQGRYGPSIVQVKSGTPVRLAIKAIGDPGCGGVTFVRGLGQSIVLRANETSTVEFTPSKPGDYRVTCSMNMYAPATLRVV